MAFDRVTGDLVTAADWNLLPRVLYRDVLASAAASVTIADADINGSLADWETLKLTVQGDNSGAIARVLRLQFNGDTAANYDYIRDDVRGNGQSVFAFGAGESAIVFGVLQFSTTAMGFTQATIAGHSRSDRQTIVNARGSAARSSAGSDHWVTHSMGQWTSNSVVTSLTILLDGDSLHTDTLIMLEGVMRREP